MKYLLLLTCSLFILNSCAEEISGEPEIISSWKLIEEYLDPGDGSGDFETVQSFKIIDFRDDATLYSNGSICEMNIQSNLESYGTYDSINRSFTSCQNLTIELSVFYEISDSIMIVSYPCFEGCQHKYEKIE